MYRTILVPLDGSELAERALPIATALAKPSGARLMLVRAAWAHVLAGVDPTDAQVKAVREAEAYLQGVTGRAATQNVRAEARVPYDTAAEGILMEVDDSDADLVVMCTHGRSGLGRLIYGSVAEEVIRRSPVPVLLVRPTGADATLRRDGATQPKLLVPLDGSARAEAILPAAIDLAEATRGELVLLHVEDPSHPDPSSVLSVPESTGKEPVVRLETYFAGVEERLRRAGLAARTEVRFGSPAGAILAAERSRGVRLVAMATHGRTDLLEPITGSVAREVVLEGTLPVLLARPATLRDDARLSSSTEGKWIEGSGDAARPVERAA